VSNLDWIAKELPSKDSFVSQSRFDTYAVVGQSHLVYDTDYSFGGLSLHLKGVLINELVTNIYNLLCYNS